ncbi:cold-inducible protein YdjO-related protein [Neobacillus sp. PS3-40]|uniref:cold-inducible protein YdjO-related protein n=1 Tax=Neobacillus sp. PS3-40 TaxID=3070679 RepID=UPI0027DF45F2|nr:cold-inducible protein YdjO-related protein [Neobacillus sp. PS3-40]WML46383.1 cold-inducible protein YdjO-related protein [Neobacillus sp. PS3-40]
MPIFYGKRNNKEEVEVILVDTEVYSCTDGSCIGWMRKDFVTEDLHCPMCGNVMAEEVRELPKM